MSAEAFNAIFQHLREIFARHVPPLVVTVDEAGHYSLDVPRPAMPAPTRYFGGVRLTKNYVSCYLMPVYGTPALQQAISPALRRRMQGKSCFNFVAVDQPLFQEFAQLTERAASNFEMYDLAFEQRKTRGRRARRD